MPSAYRKESDISLVVTRDDVRKAVCADVTRCTLALSGRGQLGSEAKVGIEDSTGEVRITWEDEGEQPKFHRGYIRPVTTAMRILMLTDQNKGKLLKQMPESGITVTIEEHRSRAVRHGIRRDYMAERERELELKQLRDEGRAEPARKRPGGTGPRSNSSLLRGVRAAERA